MLGETSTRQGEDSRVGGVVTLVHNSVRSSSWKAELGPGGHVVCTQLGSTVLVNIYGQHRPQKQDFFQNLFELLQSHDNQPWVVTGDFNEKPTASRLCRALQSQGAHVLFPSDGLGSRWESPGIIDYLIYNFDNLQCEARVEKLSDHRPMTFQFPAVHTDWASEVFELTPCNTYLPKSPDDLPLWTAFLEAKWHTQEEEWNEFVVTMKQMETETSSSPQAKVDLIWKSFNCLSSSFCSLRLGSAKSRCRAPKNPIGIKAQVPSSGKKL